MPISGCHDLPLATFNLPSRVFRHGCRRAECLERRCLGGLWGALLGIPESCCGGGRISGPLAREIPDIFRHGCRRAGKFRNDDRGGGLFHMLRRGRHPALRRGRRGG